MRMLGCRGGEGYTGGRPEWGVGGLVRQRQATVLLLKINHKVWISAEMVEAGLDKMVLEVSEE